MAYAFDKKKGSKIYSEEKILAPGEVVKICIKKLVLVEVNEAKLAKLMTSSFTKTGQIILWNHSSREGKINEFASLLSPLDKSNIGEKELIVLHTKRSNRYEFLYTETWKKIPKLWIPENDD